jgi:hypothetical protein
MLVFHVPSREVKALNFVEQETLTAGAVEELVDLRPAILLDGTPKTAD